MLQCIGSDNTYIFVCGATVPRACQLVAGLTITLSNDMKMNKLLSFSNVISPAVVFWLSEPDSLSTLVSQFPMTTLGGHRGNTNSVLFGDLTVFQGYDKSKY